MIEYIYDGYGNLLNKDEVLNNTIAKENPFIYKGYYYDFDTGLYYLTTRYYNPEWGRFLSADDVSYLDPSSIGGLNLYAYCGNNPVMYSLRTGGSAGSVGNIGSIAASVWSANSVSVDLSARSGVSSSFFNQQLFAPLKFRSGLWFGNLSATGLYAEWQVRGQWNISKGKIQAGIAGKFSLLNAGGQIGFGSNDFNVSLKGVVDVGTVSGMAGLFIDPTKHNYFVGVEAKAAVLTARGGVQLEILGIQIEAGGQVEALAIGGRLGIGIKQNADGKRELYFYGGAAVLFGADFYMRIRLW